MDTAAKRFDIQPIPLVSLYVSTDSQRRLRLSADIVRLYELGAGRRVVLGYDATQRAIAIRLADNHADPTAANVDKRGYISATHFYRKSRVEPVARRYEFASEQDGWFVFIEGESAE